MNEGIHYTPSHTNACKFLTYIFSADITPEMLKLCRVAKVKVFFLVLVYVFNFDLFEFSDAISWRRVYYFWSLLIIHHVETKKRKITWLFNNFSVNLVTSQQTAKTNF